MEFGV